MKEQILKIKKANPTFGYRKIAKIVGCNYSLVKYHLRPEVKKQHLLSQQKRRKNHPLVYKMYSFLLRKRKNEFFRNRKTRKSQLQTFTMLELINKLQQNPNCYLTGKPINISKTSSYAFDHIIPVSKGGSNDLSNLGLTLKEVNQAKNNLSLREFLQLCCDVLTHNGYIIYKNEELDFCI